MLDLAEFGRCKPGPIVWDQLQFVRNREQYGTSLSDVKIRQTPFYVLAVVFKASRNSMYVGGYLGCLHANVRGICRGLACWLEGILERSL